MPQKVAGNVTIQYSGTAITAHLSQSSLEMVVSAIDVTNFGSTAEESIAGLPGFSAPVSGPWAKALDGVLAPDMISPPATLRALIITIGSGLEQVTYTWATGTATYGAFIDNYKIDSSSPTDGLKWSGNLKISGAPVRS